MSAPKTADGRPRLATEKSDSSKLTIYSHDWSDPTTWYQNSVLVVTESAVDTGDQRTYSLVNKNIIDIYHGNITQEDFLTDNNGNSFRIVVSVSGDVKIEQDPHYASGGDYITNYSSGTITFFQTQPSGSDVAVTYHYATDSIFTIKPKEGTSLAIQIVEAQFSDDIIMTDSVIFQPYGYVDIFAPQLIPGIPSGTKIPLGNPVVYKTMSDFQNEALKAYPGYPILGGTSWRGASHKIYVFNWDYLSSTIIRADYGMEVRVRLQHDKPFEGWYSTATFYCLTEKL